MHPVSPAEPDTLTQLSRIWAKAVAVSILASLGMWRRHLTGISEWAWHLMQQQSAASSDDSGLLTSVHSKWNHSFPGPLHCIMEQGSDNSERPQGHWRTPEVSEPREVSPFKESPLSGEVADTWEEATTDLSGVSRAVLSPSKG